MSHFRPLALLVALLALSPLLAAINVRDYGAKGDGVTDDTAAIQAAFDATQAQVVSLPSKVGCYYQTAPEVLFPSGRYVLSGPLNITGIAIRGEGYACLEQTNPEADIFVSSYAWRMTFTGLTFLYGRRHLALGNPNLDTGYLLVQDCKFYASSGPAIEVAKGANSTQVQIEKCEFISCRQALVTYTDQGAMRDCWISTDPQMRDLAVIENRGGRFTLENIVGVPLVNGANQRWIDNYGSTLSCLRVRFGGEGGGFTPVINYAKPFPDTFGSSILLEDCLVCANGSETRNCAVFCEEVPNNLVIRDCQLAGAAAVKVSERLDPATYFTGIRREVLHYALEGNIGPAVGELPPLLKRPVCPPAPPKPGALSDRDLRQALARAREVVIQLPASDTGGVCNGHIQQTEPAKYIAIPFSPKTWRLDDFMDATAQRNSEHLGIAEARGRVIIMRRTPAEGTWPHLRIKGLTVDLDKTPWLTWKQLDTGSESPGSYAMRVLDRESGTLLLLEEDVYPPYTDYRAFNLRELLGVRGTRQLELKYYYLGQTNTAPQTPDNPTGFAGAKAGDYVCLEFLRFEAE